MGHLSIFSWGFSTATRSFAAESTLLRFMLQNLASVRLSVLWNMIEQLYLHVGVSYVFWYRTAHQKVWAYDLLVILWSYLNMKNEQFVHFLLKNLPVRNSFRSRWWWSQRLRSFRILVLTLHPTGTRSSRRFVELRFHCTCMLLILHLFWIFPAQEWMLMRNRGQRQKSRL